MVLDRDRRTEPPTVSRVPRWSWTGTGGRSLLQFPGSPDGPGPGPADGASYRFPGSPRWSSTGIGGRSRLLQLPGSCSAEFVIHNSQTCTGTSPLARPSIALAHTKVSGSRSYRLLAVRFRDQDIAQIDCLARLDGEVPADQNAIGPTRGIADAVKHPGIKSGSTMRPSVSVRGPSPVVFAIDVGNVRRVGRERRLLPRIPRPRRAARASQESRDAEKPWRPACRPVRPSRAFAWPTPLKLNGHIRRRPVFQKTPPSRPTRGQRQETKHAWPFRDRARGASKTPSRASRGEVAPPVEVEVIEVERGDHHRVVDRLPLGPDHATAHGLAGSE